MSEIPTIKIKYKDLAPGSPFLAAFNQVAGCTFGGRADQALMGVGRRLIRAAEEFEKLRDKAFKEHGKRDPKTRDYSVKHLDDDKYQAFETLMDGYAELEVDLKITEPVKVRKRKSHRFSGVAAALVSEVIEVEYDANDQGEYLDDLTK